MATPETPCLIQRLTDRIGYARSDADAGFTLAEAVVSLALFATVATASVVAVADSTKSSAQTGNRTTAANLAQQDLEQARAIADRTTVKSLAARTVTVGGRPYSVTRTASGTCPAVSDPNKSKITVTSSVTWTNSPTGGITIATVLAC